MGETLLHCAGAWRLFVSETLLHCAGGNLWMRPYCILLESIG